MENELQSKYQKIASEYSKIRAQVNVLKKAVIEEQNRNADLHEQLKDREVKVRRGEQELDSLTFRNQQLTKRITVLQEELDKAQSKGKKSRSKSNETKAQLPSVPNHILDEEFQKKIVENAQLLSRLNDRETEIETLNEQIQHLQYKLDLLEKTKIDAEAKSRELDREKHELQMKLIDKQKREETVSWSSGDSKREHEYELKPGILATPPRQLEASPFSSPSMSRRSSKSTVELGPRKPWAASQEESSDEVDLTRVCQMEKELNHYKYQYDVLKIKYDDVVQKQVLERIMVESNTLEPLEVSNMLGRLNAPFPIPEEIEARENKIKEYFLKEIEKLVIDKQLCQAKALALAANEQVMNIHFNSSEAKREKSDESLSEALSKIKYLQEDLDMQEGNYRTQLSTMSEHVANMNEKLVQKTEEIDKLKFELSQKEGRKRKQ